MRWASLRDPRLLQVSDIPRRTTQFPQMAPPWLSNLASISMAVGPPLVYADQTVSIIKKKYVFNCYIMTYPPLTQSPIPEIQLDFLGISVQFCAHVSLI